MNHQPLKFSPSKHWERQKRVREQDSEFLKEIRKLPCIACGKEGSEAHHIRSRGAGGGDDAINILPLCIEHHSMGPKAWHRGWAKFLENFPWVWEHLQKLGWEIRLGRLKHCHYDSDV